jgi:hypothetical protein
MGHAAPFAHKPRARLQGYLLTCGNGNIVFRNEIEFADFPA